MASEKIANQLRRIAIVIARILAVVYGIFALVVSFAQESLIFHPTVLSQEFKFPFANAVEKFETVDGLKVHSLLFEKPDSKKIVLYFHGNAGDLSGWGQVAEEISDATGTSVWIIDYPGYGKSEGKITSESQLHKIAGAFFESASRLVGGSENVILYGRSIGTGLAVKLASEYPVAKLILETPYVNLKRLAKDLLPWAPTFLMKYTFNSHEWIPKVTSPVLIVHGDKDEIIPFAHGEEIHRLAAGSQLAVISGGHHNDLSQFSEYWTALKAFIRND